MINGIGHILDFLKVITSKLTSFLAILFHKVTFQEILNQKSEFSLIYGWLIISFLNLHSKRIWFMLNLMPIEKRTGLTPSTFAKEYLEVLKPVVFTDLMDTWPAKRLWTIERFIRDYGHIQVPVVSPNYSKPGKGYMKPEKHMPFSEYLQLLQGGPMGYRLFLFNLFKYAPELKDEFSIPNIMEGFIKDFPFMFFGGKGSITPLHYDIDLSHVFLNQLFGRKRVVLFSPEQTKLLYHHPFTVASYIDIDHPDYDKYPALKKVVGHEVILEPGETVFIPAGFWHYIEYTDGGYSIALRANESVTRRAKGMVNIATHFLVDKGMNQILGKKWRDLKEELAEKNALEALQSNS
jgi:hypothetical protein